MGSFATQHQISTTLHPAASPYISLAKSQSQSHPPWSRRPGKCFHEHIPALNKAWALVLFLRRKGKWTSGMKTLNFNFKYHCGKMIFIKKEKNNIQKKMTATISKKKLYKIFYMLYEGLNLQTGQLAFYIAN